MEPTPTISLRVGCASDGCGGGNHDGHSRELHDDVDLMGLAYAVGLIQLLHPTSFTLPISGRRLTIMVLGAV